ncbi:transposase [Reyranella sp.]|uniref:transposase n=1 Tax=Reyranella sp. TaxID=1929291 RepID=UPI003523B5D6
MLRTGRDIRRRRRFSLEEKQAILRAAAEPGATVSEVSRQYGVARAAPALTACPRPGGGFPSR